MLRSYDRPRAIAVPVRSEVRAASWLDFWLGAASMLGLLLTLAVLAPGLCRVVLRYFGG
jgi:hypothetical protein